MTPLRQQVEQAVERHLRVMLEFPEDARKSIFLHSRREFVDDLCALLAPTTPDREALKKILFPGWRTRTDDKQILEQVMAWASGQSARPTWCKHWQDEIWGGNPAWTHRHSNQDLTIVYDTSETKFCEWCGAPRPATPRTP